MTQPTELELELELEMFEDTPVQTEVEEWIVEQFFIDKETSEISLWIDHCEMIAEFN